MKLLDVNVLLYAFRKDVEQHSSYRRWLMGQLGSGQELGIPDVTAYGFMRVVTHPKIFQNPSSRDEAFSFIDTLRAHPRLRSVLPSSRTWEAFKTLCVASAARGNLMTDAWIAALAMEHGAVVVSADKDFARFPGLWRQHPIQHPEPIQNPPS